MILDIFALIVMGVLLAVTIWFVVLLGPLPGKIAAQRGHPQADAIRVLGWIGLITMGTAWLVALVWAYIKPPVFRNSNHEFEDRIANLERAVAKVTGEGADS